MAPMSPSPPPLPLPRNLVEAAMQDDRQDPDHRGRRTAWLATLPAVAEDIADRWSLVVGPPFQPGGQTAWVGAVRDSSGDEHVLKLAWRHPESAHEADGLRTWDGDGAVQLHASLDLADTTALLIERCVPGTALCRRPQPEQDTIVAGLLRRLWRSPPPDDPFRPLQQMCDDWAEESEPKRRSGPPGGLDPGLARAGIALFRSLPATADRAVLLCTDLHAGNVLAAEREPWLVIDPKPYVGDPTYDALQYMLNCDQRLHADPRSLARRMAELLDLDPERLLLWLFARCVQEAPDWPELADVARRIAPA